MSDQLLARVPRNVEDEPGLVSTEMFHSDAKGLTVSESDGVPTALLEPVSGRWLGAPLALLSTETATDWTGLSAETLTTVTPFGNGGVAVVAEGTAAVPWRVKRNTQLELLRGFQLDLYPYRPEDFDANQAYPVTVEWGGRWRLELSGNEQSASPTRLLELVKTEWVPRLTGALLAGPFFNPDQPHRLWIQPLAGDEFLVRNMTDPIGFTYAFPTAESYAPEPPEEQTEELIAFAPWLESDLIIQGVPRCFWAFRYVCFPQTWQVETSGTRDLGYVSSQPVSVALETFHPDGLEAATGSAYAATLEVYAGEVGGDQWNDVVGPGDDKQQTFSFKLFASGPNDAEQTGYSKRAVMVDRCEITFPSTVQSDGATAADLFSTAGVSVLRVEENRGAEDWDSYLSVGLQLDWQTYHATFTEFLRPYTRYQWVLDTDESGTADYIRFDGFLESAETNHFQDTAGHWWLDASLKIASRWRQVDDQVFRSPRPFDGMLRSDAYTEIARLIPLDTATELEVGTLVDDLEVPTGRPGRRPDWLPRIGARLGDCLRDITQYLGPYDRLRFVQRVGGVKLYFDTPSETSQATFYRTDVAATSAGYPERVIFGDVGTPKLRDAKTANDFFNELVVVGRDKLDPSQLLTSHYAYPPSWQVGDGSEPLYIGVRRTLVVVKPELNTQEAVNRALWGLMEKYGTFRRSAIMASHLAPTVYPGDRVTVSAGTEPGATNTVYVVRGMRTQCLALEVDISRRYRTTYELEEVL